MATITLPHPNIDFVPLDILTAAEQNQLVANINALATFANGLADGTNLSDDIVLPRSLAPDFRDYSTDEKNTGKKWIDGRSIFRKVVRGTVNMTGGHNTSSLPHGIAGLTDAWELISWSGNMRLSGVLSSNPIKQALPYIEGTHQAGITSIDKTNITLSGSYAWGSSEVSIVIEYVK